MIDPSEENIKKAAEALVSKSVWGDSDSCDTPDDETLSKAQDLYRGLVRRVTELATEGVDATSWTIEQLMTKD